MRRLLPISLLAVLAVVLLALLWRNAREDSLATHESTPVSTEAPHALAESPIAEVEAPPEAREVRVLARAEPASAPAPVATATAPDPSAGTLIVHAINQANRAPLAQVRITILSKADPTDVPPENVPDAKGDLDHAPITSSEGRAEFELPHAIDFHLFARGEDGESGIAQMNLPGLGAGERREIVLELPHAADVHVVGKVISAESGEPIAGAHVQMLKPSETGTEWHKPGRADAMTGNDGLFEFRLPSWGQDRVRVDADGFGPRFASPAKGHDDLEHALLVKLARACEVRMTVLDAGGTPTAGVWVEVTAPGYALGHNDENMRGYMLAEYVSAPDEHWRAATGADGRATLRGMAADVDMKLTAEKDGKLLRPAAEALRLRAGEAREIEWRIGAGTRLNGLVLDQDGKPVASQEIWLERCTSPSGPPLVPRSATNVTTKATTDAQGRFTFEDVPAGTWAVGPASDGFFAETIAPDSVAPVAERIETANESTRELTLHVTRGLFLRGTVFGPAAEPIDNGYVLGVGADERLSSDTHSGPDGTFVLGPLTPQSYTLVAHGQRGLASSDPVVARAGDSGIVLHLKLGGSLHGRVVDAATGVASPAQVMVAPEQPSFGPFGSGTISSTNEDGTFQLGSLEVGRWGVTAMTADGRFAQRAGVHVSAGEDTGTLELYLVPGGKLELRNAGKEPRLHVTITRAGVPVHFGSMLEPGQSATLLAPAGQLVLELRPGYTGPVRRMSVELQAGETKEVVLDGKN